MPRPGETFDRYTIESVLGEGGMGVVYKAFDPRLDRRVALKVVRADAPPDGEEPTTNATARLLHEARVAAALDHPNAVAIFDMGEVSGEAFIAMELVSGRPLRAFIGQPQVPLSARIRWLHDVARVLAAAHQAGLVHRDVKPENVMIRDDGDVKVLDFGIARRVRPGATDGAAATRKGVMVGTPLYMAPEQVRGEAVDGRTDQFAWGVVAYELLTGKLPWAVGATEYDTLSSIIHDEPPPLHSVALEVPAIVADVVTRALRKNPDERFPTMDSVVHVLEPAVGPAGKLHIPLPATTDPMLPFLQTVITGEEPSYAPPPKTRPRSTPALAWWGAGAAGTVIAAMAVVHAVSGKPPPPPPAAASLPAAVPSNPAAAAAYAMALQAAHDGMTPAATDSRRRVLALEPSFAPAVLRLGLVVYGSNEATREARELFQRATAMRAGLTPAERALLDALSPCVLQYDMTHGACEARLKDAAKIYPQDLDILQELAGQQTFADELEDAIATCRRAMTIDPSYVYFAGLMGELQAYAGRNDEAMETLDQCTRVRPGATECISNRIAIHVQRAECDAVASDARDWMAAAPRDGGRWGPQHYLAAAQIAQGKPIEAVEETLAQEWAKTGEEERAGTEATDRAMLAVQGGDFAAAEEQIAALEKLAASDDSEDAHATPAALRVQLYEEEGRFAEMAAVAEAFLRRRESWTRDTREDDWEIAKDVTMRMDDALRRAGKITPAEFATRRAAWRARWDKTKVARYAWFPAYAYWVTSNEDAREALDAVPDGGLPPFRPFVYAEGAMGRARLLTGDVEGALPLLKQAASGCYALEDPFTAVRSHLWLGEALEKRGEKDAACEAYAFVVDRWGQVKPRARSADEARKRAAALGCKR